jgi:hypothetical protein
LWENKAFVALSENKYPRLPDFWFSEMPNEVYTAMPEDHKSFINSYHITNKKTETKLSLSDRF